MELFCVSSDMSVLSACDLPLSDNAIADNKAAILHKVFAEEHYVIWLF